MTSIRPVSTPRIASTTTPRAEAAPAREATTTPSVLKLLEGQSDCIFEVKGTKSGGTTTGTPVDSDGSCQAPPPPVVREA